MFRRNRLIVALTALVALWATTARADGELKKENLKAAVKDLVAEVRKVIEDEKQTAVAVGEFTGASLDANFGPGLKNMFAEELTAQKVTINRKAQLTVNGLYALVDDDKDVFGKGNDKQKAVRLQASVVDAALVKRGEFIAHVRENADIAKVLGVTAALDPKGNKQTRNEQIKTAAKNPTAVVSGAAIRAKAGSPFAVELLVAKKPRTAELKDGQAFVDIQRDEVYAVKVTNGSDRETAVTLTIDGLDAFAFSEDIDPQTKRPKFSHYIVPAKSSMVIQGWHKTSDPKRDDNVMAFLVAEYAKSQHFASKSTGEVGVLTVTFALSGTHPSDLPPADAKSAEGNGTAFGPPIKEKQEPVKRIFGDVRDVVTVRYTR